MSSPPAHILMRSPRSRTHLGRPDWCQPGLLDPSPGALGGRHPRAELLRLLSPKEDKGQGVEEEFLLVADLFGELSHTQKRSAIGPEGNTSSIKGN